MIAALEPLWWAQGITNIILCVALLQAHRREQLASKWRSCAGAELDLELQLAKNFEARIAALESAERARKELTKE